MRRVDGHLNAISPRISGTIVTVYVENNYQVTAGQPLVDLDPRDYQTALDQTKGSYAKALAALRAEHPNVPITETTLRTTISTTSADVAAAEAAVAAAEQDYEAKIANVRQAEANNAKAQRDVQRYQPLVARQEISHEQFDTVVAIAKTQAAALEAAQAAAKAAQKAVDQSTAQLRQAQSRYEQANKNAPPTEVATRAQVATREAAVQSARAQEDQAVLNLSYTKIIAPVSGIVSEKTAEVGQHVPPGELLAVSQLEDIWITANFKETQLKRMRPGQPVDVHVDAYDVVFHGYVENMPGATGSIQSLLPPENATGNFVKVVQRLPVRIRLNKGEDPDHRLRLGMSVEPKVWLR
jgi:membrane fusion protein (multidrug efflux system)